MPIASRRTLLEAFGIASITYLLPAQSAPAGKVVVVKPVACPIFLYQVKS